MEARKDKSEFNDALGYLNHIRGLFITCSVYSVNLDGHSWFMALNALFRVLSGEMGEEQILKFKDRQLQLNSKIYLRKNIKSIENKLSFELYNELQEYELALRKIYKESGLQNRLMEDASKALR